MEEDNDNDYSPCDNYIRYVENCTPEVLAMIKRCEFLQNVVDQDELKYEQTCWRAFVKYIEDTQKIIESVKSKIAKLQGFWYTVLFHSRFFDFYATSPKDVKILMYLKDVRCHSFNSQIVPYPGSISKKTLRMSYTVTFVFNPNPYLLHTTLTKKVTFTPRHLNETPIIINSGAHFVEGKDPHRINGVAVGSFFDYFMPYELTDDMTDEEMDSIEKDFTVTETLVHNILGNCIDCFQKQSNFQFD
ncbi:hypothetical protein EIN_083270 [Entamoeba invadens IP1]|uniref:hypothetical protein n=1 Tax=Entamoeba invadens IP1 TaxID=370355 RepID=UPI0002C3E416|nr:hypothetical protein EIN_083270 [Entamoeba invadens IP1]ELP85205.1 hypothetical protein EIN_083270 [Entamoeba invadens IP1]|eukprot:XP_004184551.1 hypothetical protein EIN_083270 [Entamoeba invadens IP1]